MTSVFDGMAGLLNVTFGGPVIHTPEIGPQVTIQAQFRKRPIEVLDRDGVAMLMMHPSLRVPEPVASAIKDGDHIVPASGVIYRVLNRHPSGSPAADAAVIFELREVT